MLVRAMCLAADTVAAGGVVTWTAAQLGYEGEMALGLARVDCKLRPMLQAALNPLRPSSAYTLLCMISISCENQSR